MSTQAEAPAAPDLSSLTKREALNARVAETQGATWEVSSREEDAWLLFDVGGWVVGVLQKYGEFRTLNLWRDYAGDPSAWGALMEKELGAWERTPDSTFKRTIHRAWWWERISEREVRKAEGPWCYALGESICAAVLTKYGIDPSPYIGD